MPPALLTPSLAAPPAPAPPPSEAGPMGSGTSPNLKSLCSNLNLVRSARSVQKLEFQRHPQLLKIITPEPLAALGCVNNRQKTEKVSYDVDIEGFLRLHLNWSQKLRILRIFNSV
jgi:hypothetical protein